MLIMRSRLARIAITLSITTSLFAQAAQVAAQSTEATVEARNQIEKELERVAVIERKVMVRMRDGKRMAADIYRPKDSSRKYPTIFVRTPYNFNYWDVKLGTWRDMSQELSAVKRGYAFVNMNERGRFFSEGNYDILGAPVTDAEDEFDWIASQSWSSGKIGLIGCSSTAEWQLAAAARGNPALKTIIPQGFGAGVGTVGKFQEQGNWYRGGAVQMLFIDWLHDQQNQVRPMMPATATQDELIRASKLFDLEIQAPPIDWAKAFRHLPEKDIIENIAGPHGIYADKMPVPTGGAMIQRTPNDPAWRRGGLWHADTMPIDVPGLWLMSWYDVSQGPNLAAYNYVRQHAKGDAANQQYAIIAPTLHCGFKRASEHTIVGERDMGDARLNYDAITYAWFDKFLKGEDSQLLRDMPMVQYYTMGSNKWQHSNTWPPEGATEVKLAMTSGGSANTLHGDGALVLPPQSEGGSSALLPFAVKPGDLPAKMTSLDSFTYDPMNPTPSYGGNVCCARNSIPGNGGSLDQRKMEERPDILVYTSPVLAKDVEVSGPITVTLYVSADVKDTDVTVKLLDVLPDGTVYNLDETIQRLRYRDGYDRTVWMEKGGVYKVTLTPLVTSNLFAAGHRIRLEVAGSNFPRFDRNLNTGGNNYDEVKAVVSHTNIHHSDQYPSNIVLTVVPR
jgi:putative CocE/NonD family hydrolase